MIRVGFGFDTHKLAENTPFFLGGVRISHHKGAVGHSDADTLIHAIIDALLGAAGLPDIGNQFPDTDPRYKGIDSKILLELTIAKISEIGYSIGNIDSTIVLQAPKLKDLVPEIRQSLSAVIGIDIEQISVKAKTSEKLGFIGREEGVSAYAVVLLQK
jgi:2-C-methyl-D-erythritol 2,4-cyclodiphosphate synthase